MTFLDRSEDRRHRRALIGSQYKLITGVTSDSRWLYNLLEDPLERTDLTGVKPVLLDELVASFEQALGHLAPPPEEVPSVALTEEQAEQLEQLGYIEQ
jgi:hypothetical protein